MEDTVIPILGRRTIVRVALACALGVVCWYVISAVMASNAEATVARAATDGASGATNLLLQNMFNGILFGLLLALAAVGLSLIYGTTKLSNFAHGEQVSLGAMLTYFFTTGATVSLPFLPVSFSIGLPLLVAAGLAIALAAGSGWLQDRFLWSKLRKRGVTNVQQMIVSIGLSLAMVNLLVMWFGQDSRRLITSVPVKHRIGAIQVSTTAIVSIVISLVVIVAIAFFLQRTRLGRATRAVSDNPALAAASGIRVDSIVRLVWILATGLAALGGILLALYQNGWGPDDGGALLMIMFAAVTLGGLGHPYGALVGALVIGFVAELSTMWLGSDLKYATALAILILVLLIRPQGILGKAERVG